MQSDEIRAELDREPFIPFRLHLKNGKTFDVPFRAVAHVVVGGLLVFIGLKEGTQSAKGYKHLAFDDIVRIEPRPAGGRKRKKAS
jgi:hypothetical protein